MGIWRRTKFSICSSSSTCIFSVSHSANALLVRRGPFNACTKLETDSTGQRHPLALRLLWLHVFCLELVRSLSCTDPVCICWRLSELICSKITAWCAAGQPEVLWTLTTCLADNYWQGTHGIWQIMGVKRWSIGIIKCGFPLSHSHYLLTCHGQEPSRTFTNPKWRIVLSACGIMGPWSRYRLTC